MGLRNPANEAGRCAYRPRPSPAPTGARRSVLALPASREPALGLHAPGFGLWNGETEKEGELALDVKPPPYVPCCCCTKSGSGRLKREVDCCCCWGSVGEVKLSKSPKGSVLFALLAPDASATWGVGGVGLSAPYEEVRAVDMEAGRAFNDKPRRRGFEVDAGVELDSNASKSNKPPDDCVLLITGGPGGAARRGGIGANAGVKREGGTVPAAVLDMRARVDCADPMLGNAFSMPNQSSSSAPDRFVVDWPELTKSASPLLLLGRSPSHERSSPVRSSPLSMLAGLLPEELASPSTSALSSLLEAAPGARRPHRPRNRETADGGAAVESVGAFWAVVGSCVPRRSGTAGAEPLIDGRGAGSGSLSLSSSSSAALTMSAGVPDPDDAPPALPPNNEEKMPPTPEAGFLDVCSQPPPAVRSASPLARGKSPDPLPIIVFPSAEDVRVCVRQDVEGALNLGP